MEVKDLYSEKYKTLMKKTEGNTNRKMHCVHELEELHACVLSRFSHIQLFAPYGP